MIDFLLSPCNGPGLNITVGPSLTPLGTAAAPRALFVRAVHTRWENYISYTDTQHTHTHTQRARETLSTHLRLTFSPLTLNAKREGVGLSIDSDN